MRLGRALTDNWALFLGMLMLMVANGLLGTLLTIRGNELGFSILTISLMQASYPLGALAGTVAAPQLIEKVGHIRAFSALASLVSIAAIVHLLTSDPYSWSLMRLLSGVCLPGLYVITESWLHAKAENRMRAQILSIYFMIQLGGPALGTAMVGLPDPTGAMLFGAVSILISLSIVPLLLSDNRAPAYVVPERMRLRELYRVSPMAVAGIFVVSIGFGAWFISLPLYALARGFNEAQASGVLVVAMIASALVQYPVGWIADHFDRRKVVIVLGVVAAAAAIWLAIDRTPGHVVIGFAVIAAATLPIYSILAAHANDHLTYAQIVPASGTMAFLLQLGQFFGALIGPNTIPLAGGRGLLIMLAGICIVVTVIAVARRARTQAPQETGETPATGVLGIAQPGVFQAEVMADKAEARLGATGSER
ncbi:Predicted arabinose efflux permease, MFS family [Maritimibacter sp. HL-12]|nr:Predicted arabinose efflux permease, MFS family [Maritimibacter sp. HL-12]